MAARIEQTDTQTDRPRYRNIYRNISDAA